MSERNWKAETNTLEQRKLFNSACGDLASQLRWHGNRCGIMNSSVGGDLA